MDWTCLGHAMWLVEAGGLRLLMDPLLGPSHHGGVFGLAEPRTLKVDALSPDVVIVSHRHPDHFDLDSLFLLSQRYPDAVVLTADSLVARTCLHLGFRHVSLLPECTHLDLDGVQLFTSPSRCEVEEWGILLSTPDGTVWNQIDTVLGGPREIRATLQQASEALGAPRLASGPDLAVLTWQPLIQVEHALGRATGFPHRRWERSLQQARATGASHAILGAAGGRYLGSAAWQQSWAWPVSEERAARDLATVVPRTRTYPARLGHSWRLRGGELSHEEGGGDDLIASRGEPVDRRWQPGPLPPVTDPSPVDETAAHALIATWLELSLLPACARALPRAGVSRAALQLDVVGGSHTRSWTLELEPGGARLAEGPSEDPDMINVIACSDLVDVLHRRAHWGRPLLAGRLRSIDRLYHLDGEVLVRPHLPPFFLYLALPYARATERWMSHELELRTGRALDR